MTLERSDDVSRELLRSHRSEIDRVDEQILDLLSRRMAAAGEIGRLKRALGLEIIDPAREREVLNRLTLRGRAPLGPSAIEAIFSSIITASRALQEPPRVGFLGPEGTFSHEAAMRFYGKHAVYLPFRDIKDVFGGVAGSECRTGIAPLENSGEGPVRDTLDMFDAHDLTIQAEVRLPVRHHLLTHAPDLEAVRVVYSHPMALAQCGGWIRAHLPAARAEAVASTAQAARLASTDPAAAAVGGSLAGEAAGLPVLRSEIQDLQDNTTRFVVLGRAPLDREPGERNRTSLLIGLEHRPGALFNILEPLANNGVNITRIDSRPRKDTAWEYLFFLDLEGHVQDEPVAGALSEISRSSSMLKLLGSYPVEEGP
jgi:chorismate mutase / prephenate dehydratase